MGPQEFTVQTVAYGVATVTPDLVLGEDKIVDQTPQTRTVFRSEVHHGGVRGWLIKQKKNNKDEWEDTKKIDFRKLASGEGASIELSTDALKLLVEQHQILSSHLEEHGIAQGSHKYVSGAADEVIIAGSKSIALSIAELLKTQTEGEFWREIAEGQPQLLERLAAGAMHEARRVQLELFKSFLEDDANLVAYATVNNLTDPKPEKIWQHFFERNPWIFGYSLDYQYLNILQREATVGSPTVGGSDEELLDFLMGTSEYTVLVEIKTPSAPLMAARRNRSNSWRLSNDIIFAESQILEQRASFESFADKNAEKMYRKDGSRITQSTLNPKVILIIGNKASLNVGTEQEQDIKQRTFELHRRSVSDLTILTYDELLVRASSIIESEPEHDSGVVKL